MEQPEVAEEKAANEGYSLPDDAEEDDDYKEEFAIDLTAEVDQMLADKPPVTGEQLE